MPCKSLTFQLYDCTLELKPDLLALAANRVLPVVEGPRELTALLAELFAQLEVGEGFDDSAFARRRTDWPWISMLLSAVVCATLWGVTSFPPRPASQSDLGVKDV